MTLRDPSPQDVPWVEKIRSGDREAFEALFRAFYPGLCNCVTRYVESPEVAEELVQEVFVRVWERRSMLNPRGSIDRYLYRAARNRALNHLKHRHVEDRSRNIVSVMQSSQSTPEDELRFGEISTVAQQAIDRLPDRCRQIFLLSRESDLSYAEIAKLLEISVKTVETQMGRALKTLRSALIPYV